MVTLQKGGGNKRIYLAGVFIFENCRLINLKTPLKAKNKMTPLRFEPSTSTYKHDPTLTPLTVRLHRHIKYNVIIRLWYMDKAWRTKKEKCLVCRHEELFTVTYINLYSSGYKTQLILVFQCARVSRSLITSSLNCDMWPAVLPPVMMSDLDMLTIFYWSWIWHLCSYASS